MPERKTPAELGITDREMDALLWVRDALDPEIPDKNLPDWITFEMREWGSLVSLGPTPDPICGTLCCIGGSMQMYMAGLAGKSEGSPVTPSEQREYNSLSNSFSIALDGLFFEYPAGSMRNDRGTAAAAIDRFLGGETKNPWQTTE